jgi:hypothetical protein
MEQHKGRYPEVLIVKVSAEMDAAIRQLARQDDRSLAGCIRRLLSAGLSAAQQGCR